MITEHQIRLSQAGHPQDEPETRSSGLWLYAMAIGGFTILAVIGVWAFA
jgi:hypothetical protein